METIRRAKRRIAVSLGKQGTDSRLYRTVNALNLFFFHRDDRMQLIHYGNEDPDRTYYVIRPSSTAEGLLSSYFTVVDHIRWALDRQYVPYVDFESKRCQYYTGREINGTVNAWEYYFEQPAGLTKTQIAKKKNVLLSGIEKGAQQKTKTKFESSFERYKGEACRKIYESIPVRQEIQAEAERKVRELFGPGPVLGVLLRGTDYVALKPKGHPIQPTLETAEEKIDEFLAKYPIERICVVTEEYAYFEALKQKYGDRVFSSDDDFVREYKPGTYISDTMTDDPYQRGKNYLIRLLLLAQCDYFVSGITNGSLFAYCNRKQEYKDCFWFDLGLYE